MILYIYYIALSRVAKGRHYPADVIFGACVGALVGFLVEDYCDGAARAFWKTIGGTYTTICFGWYILIPFLAKDSKNYQKILSILYLMFTISLFISSFPKSWAEAGAQTISNIDDTSTCKLYY